MDQRGGQTIIAIDLTRFACALLVVAYHFGAAFWLSPSPHGRVLLAGVDGGFGGSPLARVGWIGVELFFVISGIVIARSAAGSSRPAFLRKRVLRLAPAAWICASITALALVAGGVGGVLGDWWRSMTFWPLPPQIDGSYWTLGIEIAFYGLVAATMGATGNTRRIERAAIVLGLASTAFWAWCLVAGPAVAAVPVMRWAQLALLPHGCLFAIGVLIAAERMTPARLAFGALFTLTACVEIVQHVMERSAGGVPGSMPLALGLFLGGLGVLLVAGRLQPMLVRAIDPGAARTIGLMTYPLYLLHQDAGAALLGALIRAGMPIRLAVGLSVAAILILAWLVATALEPLVRRALSSALSSVLSRRAATPESGPSGHIAVIDLIRFACAGGVMAFHFTTAFPLSPGAPVRQIDPGILLPTSLASWTWFGWVGVEIFFVISGYVIAMSGARDSQAGFVRRRVLRLVPAAWLCASLTALVMLAIGGTPVAALAGRWLSAILFLPAATPIDASYWTLPIEVCFYLLVAWFLRAGRDDSRRIERIGIALGAASIAYWLIAWRIGLSPHAALENLLLNLSLLPYGIFFALGILLSAIRTAGATRARVGAALLLTALGCGEVAFHASSMAGIGGLPIDAAWPVGAFAIAVAAIVLADRLQAPLVRHLGTARLMTIGAMTYPLYLVHQNVGAVLIVGAVRAGVPAWWAIAAAAAVMLVLAWAIAARAEPRVRRWLAARLPADPGLASGGKNDKAAYGF